jgi:hypothetical protein
MTENQKAPDFDPGPFLLFSKITVPEIGLISNSIIDALLDFNAER